MREFIRNFYSMRKFHLILIKVDSLEVIGDMKKNAVNTDYNVYGIHKGNNSIFLFSKEIGRPLNPFVDALYTFTSYNFEMWLCRFIEGFRLKKCSHKAFQVSLKDETIEFFRLSDDLLKKNRIRNSRVSLDLLSLKRRFIRCHSGCMRVFPDCGGTLVTAYVDGRDLDGFDSTRIVHSFIKKDHVCMDYTSNLVISEETYHRLFNPVVISTISLENFLTDQNHPILDLPVGPKFYCLFRDELLNGHTFLGGKEWEVSAYLKQKILK